MGRHEWMRLTTKVAQQWYRRFNTDPGLGNGQGWNWLNGVTDITNYGPRAGGLRYNRPSNKRAFQFDLARRNKPIIGNPRTVLDLEKVKIKYQQWSDNGENGVGGLTWPRGAKIFLSWNAQEEQLSWRDFGVGGEPDTEGRNK